MVFIPQVEFRNSLNVHQDAFVKFTTCVAQTESIVFWDKKFCRCFKTCMVKALTQTNLRRFTV